jgi:hypothetical protein
MTSPRVTEIPISLEPATRDPFLEGEPAPASAAPVIRELDHRRNDGIDVSLLWNQTDDRVTVAVCDIKTGEAFEIEVEADEALDAFRHLYAHAAFHGVR